jgi:hypothetical protein
MVLWFNALSGSVFGAERHPSNSGSFFSFGILSASALLVSLPKYSELICHRLILSQYSLSQASVRLKIRHAPTCPVRFQLSAK